MKMRLLFAAAAVALTMNPGSLLAEAPRISVPTARPAPVARRPLATVVHQKITAQDPSKTTEAFLAASKQLTGFSAPPDYSGAIFLSAWSPMVNERGSLDAYTPAGFFSFPLDSTMPAFIAFENNDGTWAKGSAAFTLLNLKNGKMLLWDCLVGDRSSGKPDTGGLYNYMVDTGPKLNTWTQHLEGSATSTNGHLVFAFLAGGDAGQVYVTRTSGGWDFVGCHIIPQK